MVATVGPPPTQCLWAKKWPFTSPPPPRLDWRKIDSGRHGGSIPGEAPRQSDLLLAFVDADPDAPCRRRPGRGRRLGGGIRGAFRSRDLCRRVREANRASNRGRAGESRCRLHQDSRTPAGGLAKGRSCEPKSRLRRRGAGEGVLRRGRQTGRGASATSRPGLGSASPVRVNASLDCPSPPHVAPLGVISFSRQLFLRGGTERQEVVGFPATEAMGLFLQDDHSAGQAVPDGWSFHGDPRSSSGTAHALRRGIAAAKEFDLREVLRTATLLGVLLYKLDRRSDDDIGGLYERYRIQTGPISGRD